MSLPIRLSIWFAGVNKCTCLRIYNDYFHVVVRIDELVQTAVAEFLSERRSPQTLAQEQRKHCKCRNSNLRRLQCLRVNTLRQGVWRDAYHKKDRDGEASGIRRSVRPVCLNQEMVDDCCSESFF